MSDSDRIHRIHANAMSAHGGPYDVTLDFGYRADEQEDVVYESRISMSWEHAVSMVAILSRLVEIYEEQVPSIEALRAKVAESQAQAEAEAAAAKESDSK